MTCADVCKYAPPEKGKWPCEDCDMRYHDRAEPKVISGRQEMTFEEFCAFSNIAPDYWMFTNRRQHNTFWRDVDGFVYFDNGLGVLRRFEKTHGQLWFSFRLPSADEYGNWWSPWRFWN